VITFGSISSSGVRWLCHFDEYPTSPSRDEQVSRLPDGPGNHDLSHVLLLSSPQSRILWAEYPCGIIFPNPGVNQPLSLSDEVTSLFAALVLTQSVGVF
jgi:hypothetical protein